MRDAPTGLQLRTELSLAPAPTWGDQALLERLVSNLVENAVRYNVSGGLLRIVTGSEGDSATLVVENDGPHIPAAEVEELFWPFRRLSGDRTGAGQGAGLGLSIARAVAEAHSGSLRAVARPGGGCASHSPCRREQLTPAAIPSNVAFPSR